ncbi:hypothetical protein [Streptomyces sp. NPDC046985]|uniref:hypothetical protein n=1 Tax=Streptomyces sp. NPDC046985 TaxID=3155377 RepID=UPI00340FD16C
MTESVVQAGQHVVLTTSVRIGEEILDEFVKKGGGKFSVAFLGCVVTGAAEGVLDRLTVDRARQNVGKRLDIHTHAVAEQDMGGLVLEDLCAMTPADSSEVEKVVFALESQPYSARGAYHVHVRQLMHVKRTLAVQ